MIRFILRVETLDSCNGLRVDQLFTIDCDCPELESQLSRGGSGESGYEYRSLVGAEVRPNEETDGAR